MLALKKAPEKTKTLSAALAAVLLAQVRKQLNIEPDFTDDDTYIATLIETAIEQVEDDTNSDVIDTANVLTYEINPSTGAVGTIASHITIYASPLRAFTTLEYWDGAAWQTLAKDTDYKLDEGETNFWAFSIHMLKSTSASKFRFTFSTGYTDSKLPKKLQQATCLRASDMFDAERQGHNLNNIVENKAYDRLIAKHVRKYW